VGPQEEHLERKDLDQWIDVGIGCAALLLVLIIAAFLLLASDGADTPQGTPPARTSEEAATTK
jgi:hypothetical protein